jgi:hypothetical protein
MIDAKSRHAQKRAAPAIIASHSEYNLTVDQEFGPDTRKIGAGFEIPNRQKEV